MQHIRVLLPIICAAMLAAAAMSSCNSSKPAASGATHQESTSSGAETGLTAAQRYSQTIAGYSEWNNLKLPVSIKSKQFDISLSGQAWMSRGNEIYMSLRFMGMIEVAVLSIKGDSVVAVDKYHKIYVAERISDFMRGVPFNIEDLQNLLLGRPFVLGQGVPQATGPTPALKTSVNGGWIMTPAPVDGKFEYRFDFDSSNRLTSARLSSNLVELFAANYTSPAATPFGPFSAEVALRSSSVKPMGLTVKWSFGKADWEKRDIPRISVPSNCRRVTGRSLTNLFQGF